MTSPPSSPGEDPEARLAHCRKQLGDAMVAMAMMMLRNGADPKFVQDWVDSECERMRRIQRDGGKPRKLRR
jgi:hypothetical protein